ncbi:MAG: hypothetical protein LBI03_04475 [Clostridiales bacterium]|jgi:hypothetical protein|nr:hypothetical protein [Clostridiales bacterium]
MDYFIMHMDPRVSYAVKPTSVFGPLNLYMLTCEQIQKISITKVYNVNENSYNQYPDYLEETGLLVSEKLKQIMGKYQRNVIFKTVILIEKKKNRQEIYYFIAPPQIQCISPKSTYDRPEHVEKFVLDEEKVGDARIFCASNYGRRIFVRLDVAESILRRKPFGISFEKVTVDNKEDI